MAMSEKKHFRRVKLALTGILTAGGLWAQLPGFDIADVHASENWKNPYTLMSGGLLRGGRYDLRKATMLDLIRTAYDVPAAKVVGGPNWLEFSRYDVSAKAPPSTMPEVRLMLQTLLADRFKLAVHQEVRPVPAFVMKLGKGKPKLREADPAGKSGCQSLPQSGGGPDARFSCRNMTMEGFAKELRAMAYDYIADAVVDSTGLQGTWDIDLEWNRRSQALPPGTERHTVFDAVDKQLGLTLAFDKAPAQVLVVDRVNEKPTPNPPGVARVLPPRSLEFEVGDVKPSTPDEKGFYELRPSGLLEIRANPLNILIGAAWDIDFDHVNELVVAPKWIESRRFDITARTAAAPTGSDANGFMDDDLRLMLRSLLIDRFKIQSHYEDRPVKAYILVAVKPRMKKADPSNRSKCRQASVLPNDPRDLNPRLSSLISCTNLTMAQFAKLLLSVNPGDIATEVEDGTGLQGSYDFMLNFTPSYLMRRTNAEGGRDGVASDPEGGLSFFDALTKQLGLKLEMRKRRVPVVVIDHIEEKPTGN
jgi:uncharacterized protein (TIGR03435 family)